MYVDVEMTRELIITVHSKTLEKLASMCIHVLHMYCTCTAHVCHLFINNDQQRIKLGGEGEKGRGQFPRKTINS